MYAGGQLRVEGWNQERENKDEYQENLLGSETH